MKTSLVKEIRRDQVIKTSSSFIADENMVFFLVYEPCFTCKIGLHAQFSPRTGHVARQTIVVLIEIDC